MRPAIPPLLRALALGAVMLGAPARAQPPAEALRAAAGHEKAPLLDTLRDLVAIESGSRDLEGLARLADLIAGRLRDLGGTVELVDVSGDMARLDDAPAAVGRAVRGTFRGSGTRSILLIAHMDTVYLRGMGARQPFRVEDGRAYGLGIADDKQGIALILHVLAMLRDLDARTYGTLTVLIDADEEISAPGSRGLITRLGAEHDATLSFEPSRAASDKISLATAGIGSATLTVTGRASHAGSAPEQGVNALVELAHQILATRDLSRPETGLKFNWTLAQAGQNRNVIPPQAKAQADVRVLRVEDYEGIEEALRSRLKARLLPEAKVDLLFERRRPPLEATPASRALAAHAQAIYREIGRDLVVDPVAEGGGTDAGFAALRTRNPVVERFGLQGYGFHSNDAEYVLLDSIEPRLYLAARLIMDIADGRVPAGAP